MTNYSRNFNDVKVVFDEEIIDETLGKVLKKAGETQIHVPSKKKYPHLDFSFSQERERQNSVMKKNSLPKPKRG